MSIINAYLDDGNVVNINDYNIKLHKGKVKCCQGHSVHARKGHKMRHHYAHCKGEGSEECSREMGEWHISSQDRIKNEYLEKRIYDGHKYHIADVLTDSNIVIEFQKSIISPNIIQKRDSFYSKHCKELIWVICAENMDITLQKINDEKFKINLLKGSSYFKYCKSKVFLDQGKKEFIQIIDMHNQIGKLVSFQLFDSLYLKNCIKPDADKRLNRHSYIIN
jgi:competence CoiA-like predicted nuclease